MDKCNKATANGGHLPPKRQRLNDRSNKSQEERLESQSRGSKSTAIYTGNKSDPFTSPNVHNRHIVSEEKRRTLRELVKKQKQERAAALKLAEEKERERQRRIAENLAATAGAARLAASRTIQVKKPKPSATTSTSKSLNLDKDRHHTSVSQQSDVILPECAQRASQLLAEADGDAFKKPQKLPPRAASLAPKSPKTNRDPRTTYVAPSSTIRLGVDSSHRSTNFESRTNNLQRSYPPPSTSRSPFCNPEPAVLSQSLPTKSRTRRYAEITQTRHLGAQANMRSHPMAQQLGASEKKQTWKDAASEEARLKARLCASRARRFVHLEADGDDAVDGVNGGSVDDILSSGSSSTSSAGSSISDLQLASNDPEDIDSDTDEVSVEVEAAPLKPDVHDDDEYSHTTLEEGLRLLHERNARLADFHRFMEVYKQKNQLANASPNLDTTLKAKGNEGEEEEEEGEDSGSPSVEVDKTSDAAPTIPSLDGRSSTQLEEGKQQQRLAPAALGMSLTAELRRFETLSASEQHIAGLEMTRQLSQAQAERLSVYELHQKPSSGDGLSRMERFKKDLSDKAVSPMVFSRSQLPLTYTETITQRSFTATTATTAAAAAAAAAASSTILADRTQLDVTGDRLSKFPHRRVNGPDASATSLDVYDGDKIPANLERTFKVEDLPVVKSEEGNALLQRRYNELDSMRREAENMYRFAGILDREDDRVSALYIKAFQRLSSEPKSKKVAMAIASALDQPQSSTSSLDQTLKAIKAPTAPQREEVEVASSRLSRISVPSSSVSSSRRTHTHLPSPPPPPPPPPNVATRTQSPIPAEPIASSSQRINEPSVIDLSTTSRVSTIYDDPVVRGTIVAEFEPDTETESSLASTASAIFPPHHSQQLQHHNSGSLPRDTSHSTTAAAPLRVNFQLVTSFDGDAEALAQLQREIRYYEKLKTFILRHKAEYNRDGIKRSKTFLSVHMKYIKDLMQKLEEEKSHLESEIERSSASMRSRAHEESSAEMEVAADSVSDSTVSERRFPSRSLEALSQRLRVEESLMSSLVGRIKQGLEKEMSEKTASKPPAKNVVVVEEEDVTTASSISSNISEVAIEEEEEAPQEPVPAKEEVEEHSTIEAVPDVSQLKEGPPGSNVVSLDELTPPKDATTSLEESLVSKNAEECVPDEDLDARVVARALKEEAESNGERSVVVEALQTSSAGSGSSESAEVYTADFEDEEEVDAATTSSKSETISEPEDQKEVVESRELVPSKIDEVIESKLDEGIPIILMDIMEDLVEDVVEGACGIPPEVQMLREACPDMPHDIARGKVANMPHRLVPLFQTGLDFFLRLRQACQPGRFEQALRETAYPPEFVATFLDPADLEIARRNDEAKWINRMLFFDLMREEMQCIYAGEDEDIRLNRPPRLTSDRIRLWRGNTRPEGKAFWESHMRPQLENILGASLDPVKAAQDPPQMYDLDLPEPQVYDKSVERNRLTRWTLQCKRNIEDILVELDMRADDASWRVNQAHMQAAIRNATEQVFDKILDSVLPQVVAEVREENPGIVVAPAAVAAKE